jgi:polysaccharide export outer membrane protein
MKRGTTLRLVAIGGLFAAALAYVASSVRDSLADAERGQQTSDAMPAFPLAIELLRADGSSNKVQLCKACCGTLEGVDCGVCGGGGEAQWSHSSPIPWEVFAQGEYVGPARTPHVPEYQLRVDDMIEVVYWFTYEANDDGYRFEIGDEVIIESLSDPNLNRGDLNQGRGLMIQPDGTITLPLLNQVPAKGRTIEELRAELEQRFEEFYKLPTITVTPLKTNARLEALRAAIDARFGTGGQLRRVQVTPEGTVQLPALPSTQAHGLTLAELERELEARYSYEVGRGVNVTVSLAARAPAFVYVIGEVATPGQFTLQEPTTAIGAISLAGGWNNGANLREIVVMRRTEDWRLIATKLDLRGALLGKKPCPSDEIWIRDSDVIIVPKSPILLIDDFINLVFTRGIYGVVPFQGMSVNFAKASTI